MTKRNDLLCDRCHGQEATTLLYWLKPDVITGRINLINPSILCNTCKQMFNNTYELFETQPRLISFWKIGRYWNHKKMGLTSRKNYEFTALANKYWTKKLHRIMYIYSSPVPFTTA